MVENMINSVNRVYEGVVIIGDDIGVKIQPSWINTSSEEIEYFHKGTCLCRSKKLDKNKVFIINYNVKSEDDKLRIQ